MQSENNGGWELQKSQRGPSLPTPQPPADIGSETRN